MDNRKTAQIIIMLSPSDKEAIRRVSDRLRMGMSAFARSAILQEVDRRERPAERRPAA